MTRIPSLEFDTVRHDVLLGLVRYDSVLSDLKKIETPRRKILIHPSLNFVTLLRRNALWNQTRQTMSGDTKQRGKYVVPVSRGGGGVVYPKKKT